MRRLVAIFLILLVGGIFCSPLALGQAAAAPAANSACAAHSFFGLVPWYQYLQLNTGTGEDGYQYCEPSFTLLPNGKQASSVPLVLLAVLDDMVRIAGFAAVGYVIYGGVKYITSQGAPDATKQAQTTILNAVIGLVIAIVATAFVSYIGRKLAAG